VDVVAICNSRNSYLLFKIQVLTFEKLGVALDTGGRTVIINHRRIYSLLADAGEEPASVPKTAKSNFRDISS
jgi:hypothetical protein